MDARFPALTVEQVAALSDRQFEDKGGRFGRSYRSRAQRDRDRVLYSSAFQRLAYVTQVTAPEAGHAFHNRLSHSLKVAQVGRRNAERLQRLVATGELTGAAAELAETLEPDAVEASCLAHDLGHPPFGHVSEKALHAAAQATLGKDFDGFEGNAQSFRIVTRLAVRVGDVPGLDLTRRTLNGLLKYPWGFSGDPASRANRKWGYYDDDGDAFGFARPGPDASPGVPEARCLEAEIMDWADDLTYAVHDLDDFFRAGLIPLDRLGDPSSLESEALADVLENARVAEPKAFPACSSADLVAAVHDALEPYGPEGAYEHTAAMRASMRKFGSDLITRYLEAFKLGSDPSTGQATLEIDADARCEVEALKLLVRVFIIRRPGLAVVQHGQETMIRHLFDCYYDAATDGEKGDRRLFPAEARERLQRSETDRDRARVVIDLIAGLTEEGAAKLYRRLTGASSSSQALDATADFG